VVERSVQVREDEMIPQGVFVNTYEHTLDPKKRLTVPSEWRELVGVPRKLLVLPGIKEKCLCVYPARELMSRMDKLRKLSIADEKGRRLARTLASLSDLAPWDSQGRIRIKDSLLKYAGLSGKVVLAGTFDGFEIWSPDRWETAVDVDDLATLGEAAKYVGF